MYCPNSFELKLTSTGITTMLPPFALLSTENVRYENAKNKKWLADIDQISKIDLWKIKL